MGKKIIIFILNIFLFYQCANLKSKKYSDIDSLLTGNDTKYWNIHPNKMGYIGGDCWAFRKNGTFSYYDYIHFKKENEVKIVEWYGDDIKVGENGIIPWILKSDTILVDRINYKIIKLNFDTLIVKMLVSNTSNPDSLLLFTKCSNCTLKKP